MGGLGNQLFQIFTTISYAIKINHEFKFINSDKLGGINTSIRNTYWKSLFSKMSNCLFKEYPNFDLIIREESFNFKDILNDLLQPNANIILVGYFQSYKYFEKNFKLICMLLDIFEKRQELLKECVTKNILNISKLNNTISLHFRIGDYKQLQLYHPIMDYEYYKKSLEYILKNIDYNPNIIYFCEDKDIDEVNEKLQKLEIDFPSITFIRAPNVLDDWQQLLLMSCCRHNIIANSSFSWWGAYFNSHEDKIVCYPGIWFGPAIENKDTSDLFPSEWIKI
jgi:hypothetical protein